MKAWTILLCGLWVLPSCQDQDAIVGQAIPNSHPQTEITATPPILDRTDAFVTFHWRGTDRDGEVVAFEWRISDNGRDGVIDLADTLESRLPWRRTTATDSTFFVTADVDSFAEDIENPRLAPGQYRFWQTHTLFVRAIDDRGARDRTPANVSFTATTLAPTVIIDVPPLRPSITCTRSSRVLTFGWRARDPDPVDKKPAFIRWIVLPFETSDGGCATLTYFEDVQPIRGDDPLWSDWIAYDAAHDSGRTVTLPKQALDQRFLFAVQALDASGAITPTFEWNRNVRYVETNDNMLPGLVVRSNVGGEKAFVGTRGVQVLEAIQDQTLNFEWEGDASLYAGVIDAYRYGWNITDPTDPRDPGWTVEWGNGPTWKRSAPRAFSQGSPNLIIQCRDNSGTLTQAFFQFQLLTYGDRGTQKNLLVIDDFPNGNTSTQIALDQIWDERWRSFFLNRVRGFGDADLIDAQKNPERVGFTTIGEYKSVIWFTSPNEATFLRQNVASLLPEMNWLEVYQSRAGNLLVCGPSAVHGTLRGWNTPYPLILSRGGRQRWPFDAWCLSAISVVRPAGLDIYGETPGNPRRTHGCDGLILAEAAETFFDAYPSARGRVRDLAPTEEREMLAPEYNLPWEEFYNTNATNLRAMVVLRSCQTPMYLHRARRDEGRVESPETNCFPRGYSLSTIDHAPIGIASSTYSESKPLVGSEDFLWGFHPMAFDAKDVQDALLWIAQERWQLPVR